MQNGEVRLKRIGADLPDGAERADWIERGQMVMARGKVIRRRMTANMFSSWNGKLYLKVDEAEGLTASTERLDPGVYFDISKGARVVGCESIAIKPGIHNILRIINMCRLKQLRETDECTWNMRKKVLRAVSDMYYWVEGGVYEIALARPNILCSTEPCSFKTRRPDFAGGGITEAEARQLKGYVERWMDRAQRTKPIEPETVIPAINNLYRSFALKEPRIVIASSPLEMAIAGSFATALWYARKNGPPKMDSSRKAFAAMISDEIYEATVQTAFHGIDDVVDYATERSFEKLLDDASGTATRRSIDGAAGHALESALTDATEALDWAQSAAAGYRKAKEKQCQGARSTAGKYKARQSRPEPSQDFGNSVVAAIFDATCAATDTEGVPGWTGRTATVGWNVEGLAEVLSGGNERICDLMLSCVSDCKQFLQHHCNTQRYDECLTSALSEVLGVRFPAQEKYTAWQDVVTNCGPVFMHEEFCIVSDVPELLKVDEEMRPHCDTGPSYRWKDGWTLYHWHGTRVNRQFIEAPETLTVDDINLEPNLEMRRLMLERYGVKRFLMDSEAREIHRDEYGVLYAQEIDPALEPIVMVKVINATAEPDGTLKEYFLRVPPYTRTAKAAVAWTFGMRPEEFRPVAQT